MLDFTALDREIAVAARRVRAFHASLREPHEEPAPVASLRSIRAVSRRELYEELSGFSTDPWGQALRRWVAYLTLERVTEADQRRAADARRRVEHRTEKGELVSVDELVRRAVFAPRDPEPSALELARASSAARDGARFAAARWLHAANLLDGLDLPSLEHPGMGIDALDRAATGFLSATDGLRHAHGRPWWEALVRGFARDAGEGWPVRPSGRWVESIFGGTVLVEGLRPVLTDPPEPLGAASFARLLGRFGRELAQLDRPAGPFASARLPFDPSLARRAALFAGLVLEPSFHRRALGLGRAKSSEQARRIATALLPRLRLLAAHARMLDDFARWGDEVARDAYRQATFQALGIALPGELFGVLPRLPRSVRLEWQGVLSGAVLRRELRDRYDEDWWRNPRAHEQLRHEQLVARKAPVAPDPDDAVGAITEWLVELGVGA